MGSERDETEESPIPRRRRNADLPAPLRDWRVLEIDGEATVVAVPPQIESASEPSAPKMAVIDQSIDDVVVAGLVQRKVAVDAGQETQFAINLVNNGRNNARFDVRVEGWVDERWFPDLPVKISLQPGEKTQIRIVVRPPRGSDALAGEHEFAVLVRSPDYPGRLSRCGATLEIRAFRDLVLGLQPHELRIPWRQRYATAFCTLTNSGNQTETIRLFGLDRERRCTFVFHPAGEGDLKRAPQPGQTSLRIGAGQTIQVPVEIIAHASPLIGLGARKHSFYLIVEDAGGEAGDGGDQHQRMVEGAVAIEPLVGAWQFAAITGLLLAVFVGVAIVGLSLLWALQQSVAVPAPQPVQPAEPQIVAIVLNNVGEPVPTRPAPGSAEAATPAAPVPAPVVIAVNPPAGQVAGPDGAPIVALDQVTAPGEPTPIRPAVQPVVVVRPTPANMTYGQMFQEIALRYDLDWRVLAAQAYVESGFDSLALGSNNDLGLMQIRPSTWQEWAPIVEVSDPFDSHSNVTVGAAYLDHLRTLLAREGHLTMEWMLVAYNWGPDKLLSYLDSGGTWETLDLELRDYATDVLRIAQTIPPQ